MPESTMPMVTPAPVDVAHAWAAPIWVRFHCWATSVSPAAVVARAGTAVSSSPQAAAPAIRASVVPGRLEAKVGAAGAEAVGVPLGVGRGGERGQLPVEGVEAVEVVVVGRVLE